MSNGAPHDTAAMLAALLRDMPDPWSGAHTAALEDELAGYFSVAHAIAVSSGTAALHCALAALDLGPGDEVLVPAMSVVMSIAPITYTGARPVFVDCDVVGSDFDYTDLAAKLTDRTRCVLPVYLWGRAGNPARLSEFAAAHNLTVVEDACQALGTRFGDRLLGTFGDLGCFSTKDGKLLWSGEGGFVLTNNDDLAARCRAVRSHWQTPPPGQAPLARIGHNYRLSEPQAVIARANLRRIDELLARRRHQTALLLEALAGEPTVRPLPTRAGENWNGYSPVALLTMPRPRQFSTRLAALGVPNSIGTFGLSAADQRPAFARYDPAPCPQAAALLDATLAVIINDHDDDERLTEIATIIAKEAARWPHA